jgi:DNA recombination protein RmuC
MDYVLPIVLLLVGIAVGSGACWLLMRAKIEHARQRGESASEADRAALTERLDARQKNIDDLDAQSRRLESQLREHQLAETNLRERAVELETTLQQERKQAEEKLAVLDEAQRKLSDAFKALAAEALKSNNQSFLELAKATLETFQETAKGDLDKRQEAIHQLVKPVKESLKQVDTKILDLEKARVGAYEGLKEQVGSLLKSQKDLHSETSNLVKALRRPQVRGRWGEIQLRRVVEMAGMLDHCDFYEQQSTETETGRLRPDLLVRLPGDKTVVVDSKAPLEAYIDAVEATDDETRTDRLKAHARHVRKHISDLSKKSYFEQFDRSPEFVVLFLPGEVFFSAALEHDPGLIEMGVDQNVIIATPTTLIALLRAVSFGWRQERLAENAKEISDLGKELYKRLASMSDSVRKLGRNLSAATDAYNTAVGSLEARVLVSARKFKDLDAVGVDAEIEPLAPVETTPRRIQAPELLPPDPAALESSKESPERRISR